MTLILSCIYIENEALWTKCLCAITFLRNNTLLKNIEFAEENINSEKYGSIWTLFKLFLSGFFLCHKVGTVYYFLGVVELIFIFVLIFLIFLYVLDK